MDEIKDMSDFVDPEDNPVNEEVVSYFENDMIWFKIDLIVPKPLITKNIQKTLQKCFNTFVTLTPKEENILVTISGEEKKKVIETKNKLNELSSLSRKKIPFTHLITVPFNCEPLRQEFTRFKDNVLTNFKDGNAIDESLFQTPIKLHLTFCVLVLLNRNELLLAQTVLKQCVHQIVGPIIDGKPLKISIEGLNVIKGQPNRAHVLYAQIKDESNKFQSIADKIVEQFVKSGLLEESNENKVKLHITFMNSIFRQRILSKTTPNPKRIKREAFNAKPIIDFYKTHKFGEIVVESIQLNDIKTKTEDGFYGFVDSIDLPKE